MPKVSFNPQAFGIAGHCDSSDVRHAEQLRALIPVVVSDTSIQALFEALGFTNVERLPSAKYRLTQEDIDR